MPEDSFRHVSKPAPNQTVIGRWNLKGTIEKQRPYIRGERCTKPDEDCANEGESQTIHEVPVYYLTYLAGRVQRNLRKSMAFPNRALFLAAHAMQPDRPPVP